MIGSNATLSADNIESANLLALNHNSYLFDADGGGVSPITLSNAVNITNNDLVVNLNGLAFQNGDKLLLFDAAPGQIFGTFASSTVFGSPEIVHRVISDQATGDIKVRLGVPEPSTMVLLGLAMVMVISAKRRALR